MDVKMFLASFTLLSALGAAQALSCYWCSEVIDPTNCAASIDPLNPPPAITCTQADNFCATNGTAGAIQRNCFHTCPVEGLCCQTDLCNSGPQPATIDPTTAADIAAAATAAPTTFAPTSTAASLTCYSCNSASNERCIEDPIAVPIAVCPGAKDYCTTTEDGVAITRGCAPRCPTHATCCQTNLCNSETGSGSAAIVPYVTGSLIPSIVVLAKTLLT